MALLYGAIVLQEAIKRKRKELHEVTNQKNSLIHPDVLQVSQQLDDLIVQAQRGLIAETPFKRRSEEITVLRLKMAGVIKRKGRSNHDY